MYFLLQVICFPFNKLSADTDIATVARRAFLIVEKSKLEHVKALNHRVEIFTDNITILVILVRIELTKLNSLSD